MIYSTLKQPSNFFTAITNWLLSDLKQSISLADQPNLFEDVDFKDLKADHPQASLFYGSYFKTLTKLCLIPGIIIIADLLLVLTWGLIVGLFSGKTPLFFINLMFEELGDFLTLILFTGFIGTLYFGILYMILSRYVWRFTLLEHIFCPKLKYGYNIVKIIKKLTMFGIKIFLLISIISSLVGTILYHRPIMFYLCLPIVIVSFVITHWLINAELQRIGIKPLFTKISSLLKGKM